MLNITNNTLSNNLGKKIDELFLINKSEKENAIKELSNMGYTVDKTTLIYPDQNKIILICYETH